MRTEHFKRGIFSLLLVLGLAFSMISVAPLASPGDLIYDPGGENIEVVQGDNFLIRHTLEWNEPENGAYAVTMGWDCYDNKPSENFTFLSASAYFTTGDYAGESILAVVTLDSAPSPDYPGSTKYALGVSCPPDQKDSRNGQFNVDIWMRASGVGGVPHIPGDHVIPWHFAGAAMIEKGIQFWYRDTITIRVLGRGVAVAISPGYQSGPPETTLEYTVTITNTGTLDDKYELTISDYEGWGPTLDNYLFENVQPGENRIATLGVTVPENATSFVEDNITVTATSVEYAEVSDSASCVARVQAPPGVVSYWKFDEGSENIAYDNSGYGNYGTIYGATWTTGKIGGALNFGDDDYVLVPSSPSLEITDELTLEAWVYRRSQSRDEMIVSKRSGESGFMLYFYFGHNKALFCTGSTSLTGVESTIDIETNKWYHIAGTYDGEVRRIYINGVLNNSQTAAGQLASNTVDLAISKYNVQSSHYFDGVIDEVRIYNRALSPDEILRHYLGMISILPDYQSGSPGENLSFTVRVTNVGTENDDYTLNVTDTAGWNPTLSDNLLENVGPGENRVITLSVTIPENATSFVEDNITVTATSVENALVSDNASCVARVQAPPGVVSYWKFDEGSGNITYDNSGYGNYGTIYGATWTEGRIGGALYFDGDDYVLVPNSPSLAITDELTLEAWIKVQYSEDSTILAKRYRFTEVGYGLHFWNPERMVSFNVGATSYGGLETREISLTLDEWYHIAGTYIENTGEWKIYVNGVLENSLTRPGELASNNAPLYIGSHHDSSFFRGVIDEIRIYNRALSPDEISQRYLSKEAYVQKVTLEVRFTEVPLEWALALPAEKTALEIEFSGIPLYWALAPD